MLFVGSSESSLITLVCCTLKLRTSATRWQYNSRLSQPRCLCEVQKEESHQATVDGDALFGSIAGCSGSLQPLGTCQVHKVKLGRQRLVLVQLRVSVGHFVISLIFLLSNRNTQTPAMTQQNIKWDFFVLTRFFSYILWGITLQYEAPATWKIWCLLHRDWRLKYFLYLHSYLQLYVLQLKTEFNSIKPQ